MARLIDVRTEIEFEASHVPGSANLPLEQLRQRTHELPPASEPLWVIDRDPARAAEAVSFLCLRGNRASVVSWDPTKALETGPSRVRLWQPSPFLVEAIDRIGNDGLRCGRALDVACGSGREAVYLALQDYQVEAIDILSDALSRAQDLARRCGVSIETRQCDLERQPLLPENCYNIAVVFRFLQRSLLAALRSAIRPGGYIVYETFHELTRGTGRKPQSPDHLLSTGELSRAFEGFEVLILREAHERDGRFFSSLLARKPDR